MMIRRAIYNDIPTMVNLLSELFSIEDDFTIDTEKQLHGLKLLLDTQSAILLVVESDSRVIAMATLQTLVSTAMGENVGLIEDVVVTKSHRGNGIGKRLLEALIIESEKAGLKRLALGADHRNHAAIAFYQKHGFAMSHMGLMYRVM
jgi:GNAT superfamily N-acetyltransferase